MVFDYNKYKSEFDKFTKFSQSILITSHINPDGDAISSVLSTYYYLINILKIPQTNVRMVITGCYVPLWKSLSNYEKIEFVEDIALEIADNILLVILDNKEYDRISNTPKKIKSKNIKTICIDHHTHPNTQEFDLYIGPNSTSINYTSTAELLYYILFEPYLKSLDSVICKILLTGIYTDTGSFRFIDKNNSKVFDVAKNLINQGDIVVESIVSIFDKTPLGSFQVWGLFLQNISVHKIGKWPEFSLSFFNKSDLQKFSKQDYDEGSGLFKPYITKVTTCSWGIVIKPVYSTSNWSISFRAVNSNKFIKVNEIAGYFGGGGHTAAAGAQFDSSLSLEDCKNKIFEYLKSHEPIYVS